MSYVLHLRNVVVRFKEANRLQRTGRELMCRHVTSVLFTAISCVSIRPPFIARTSLSLTLSGPSHPSSSCIFSTNYWHNGVYICYYIEPLSVSPAVSHRWGNICAKPLLNVRVRQPQSYDTFIKWFLHLFIEAVSLSYLNCRPNTRKWNQTCPESNSLQTLSELRLNLIWRVKRMTSLKVGADNELAVLLQEK